VVLMDLRMPNVDGVVATKRTIAFAAGSHIYHLFAKIRARSRAQAVGYAYDHGLVSLPP
jgi:DNA-binding NarL/FixJ family response regulator